VILVGPSSYARDVRNLSTKIIVLRSEIIIRCETIFGTALATRLHIADSKRDWPNSFPREEVLSPLIASTIAEGVPSANSSTCLHGRSAAVGDVYRFERPFSYSLCAALGRVETFNQRQQRIRAPHLENVHRQCHVACCGHCKASCFLGFLAEEVLTEWTHLPGSGNLLARLSNGR
jgi:hypothetical protein